MNEADVDQGFRIKAIEKIAAAVGPAVTAAKYKYKPVSHNGFYILPDFGYLSKLKITGVGEPEEAIFKISVNDVFAQPLAVNGKPVNQANIKYEHLLEVVDDIGLAMAKTLIAPANFNGIKESIDEEALLEYGPFSKVLNAFKNVADKLKDMPSLDDIVSKKSANYSERKGIEAILTGISESLCEGLESAISSLLQDGKRYVKVVSKISDDELIIELKSDFVLAITFNADPRDSRKVIVSKILTPLGEVKVKGKSLSETFELIGKVLNIDFKDVFKVEDKILIDLKKEDAPADDKQVDDKQADDSATDPADLADKQSETDSSADAVSDVSDKKIEKSNSWEDLIGADAFAALNIAKESISIFDQSPLTETYKLSVQADNYMNALKKVKDDAAAAALVRYYLYKETSGAISEEAAKAINDKFIFDILNIIKDNNTFNPNINIELLYILNFIKRNKNITSMAIALAENLPDSCKHDQIVDNKDGILYSKALFNTSNDVKILSAIISYWYKATAFQKSVLTKLTDTQKKNLVDTFGLPNQIISISPSDVAKLKKAIFIQNDSSGGERKFRDPSTLKAIAKYILKDLNTTSTKATNNNVNTDDESAENVVASDPTNTEAIDYLDLSEDELKELKIEDINKIIKGSAEVINSNSDIKDAIITSIISILKQ